MSYRIVNPARAGMIPSPIRLINDSMSKPRASGDDPALRRQYRDMQV